MIRDAIILAAGLGVRLQPLTSVRAKPAIPVGGEPLIRQIVVRLVSQGVTNIVVNLHHLPWTITGVLGDGRDLGAHIRYSWEPVILGSAGGPRLALPMLGSTFFVVNGDTLSDVDLRALADAHEHTGALVTMALIPNRRPLQYGGVRLDGERRVTGFAARGSGAVESCHFVGIQAASARAFEQLEAGRPAGSVGGAYDNLISTNPGSIRGFLTDGEFWDIGTVADYLATSRARPLALSSGLSAVDPTARVVNSILWDDVSIGANAEIEDCIVTDRVRIPPGSRYRRVILVAEAGDTIAAHPLEARG